MPANNTEVEKRLWEAADDLRANSRLRSPEYSTPVLGLIFLRCADEKFAAAEKELKAKATRSLRLPMISEDDYRARNVLYLPREARFDTLLNLPEGRDLAKAITDAMKAVEEHNPDLKDVLPKTYNRLDNATLRELLRTFHSIPMDIEGDVFGKIYEYFLGRFAMAEGQTVISVTAIERADDLLLRHRSRLDALFCGGAICDSGWP